MFSIEKCPIPANTLLDTYSQNGTYVDCYSTVVREEITFPEFIFGFYTTPLFRLERSILKLLVSKPSTDQEVRSLADGMNNTLAAWTVEDRRENEILMCDFVGRTRSWLMTAPVRTLNGARTRLYFGSAVVPIRDSKTGKTSLGFRFQALLGFHQVYSILLLYSAKSNMER